MRRLEWMVFGSMAVATACSSWQSRYGALQRSYLEPVPRLIARDADVDWIYGRVLARLHEPAIWQPLGVTRQAFRCASIAEEGGAFVVRIQERQTEIVAYYRDSHGQRYQASIAYADWKLFLAQIQATEFWVRDLQNRASSTGFLYVLEGYDGERHRIVRQWAGEQDDVPYLATCRALWALAGVQAREQPDVPAE